MCDLERSTVEFVAEDRETASLAAYYTSLTDEQRAAIKAVAMDMWDPYIRATREGLPDGEQQAGVRSVPHHAGDDESRGHCSETGTPGVSPRR